MVVVAVAAVFVFVAQLRLLGPVLVAAPRELLVVMLWFPFPLRKKEENITGASKSL